MFLRPFLAAAALALCPVAVAPPAFAEPASGAVSEGARLYLGVGYDDIRDRWSGAPGAWISWGSAPFGARQNWRYRLGGMISADQDYWIGGGISYEHRFGGAPWYLEAGFAPGIYSRGDAAAGADAVTAPSFLTHVAVGRVLASGADVSLSFSHRSSGRIDSDGAISEELNLRYAVPF